jgi:hypothetical protein
MDMYQRMELEFLGTRLSFDGNLLVMRELNSVRHPCLDPPHSRAAAILVTAIRF